ncbi:MAG: hypothetical protein ACKVVP_08710 [Chloroflexota bacterium]
MIFLDRSVPKSIANALKCVRGDVSWLEDHFPHNTADPVWLAAAGAQGWLVIVRDKKTRTRPAERYAIIANNVGLFCLAQKRDPTRWQYLQLIVSTLDEMERRFAATPRPFIYRISKDGQFRQSL